MHLSNKKQTNSALKVSRNSQGKTTLIRAILLGTVMVTSHSLTISSAEGIDGNDFRFNDNYVKLTLPETDNTPSANMDALVKIVNDSKHKERIMIDVHGKNFEGADFSTPFQNRKLKVVFNFTASTLTGANFQNCKLWGANFSNAKLQNANFTGADLRHADDDYRLRWGPYDKGGSQKETRPVYADTSFKEADISGANFQGASISLDMVKDAIQNIPANFTDIKSPKKICGYEKSR